MFHATAHLTARAASGNVRATGSLIRKRLLLAGAVATLAAGMSALAVTEEAGASLGTSYYASFPNALCEATSISFHAPTSVSPWAGDKNIAWRGVLWRAQSGSWLRERNGTLHYAQAYSGWIYTPTYWGSPDDSITITRPGVYALTAEVYSYGQGDWRVGITLPLKVMDSFGYEIPADACHYGSA